MVKIALKLITVSFKWVPNVLIGIFLREMGYPVNLENMKNKLFLSKYNIKCYIKHKNTVRRLRNYICAYDWNKCRLTWNLEEYIDKINQMLHWRRGHIFQQTKTVYAENINGCNFLYLNGKETSLVVEFTTYIIPYT